MKVAVYGSLRSGFHNHRIIASSKFLGTCETDPNFTMVALGSFPGIFMHGNTSIKVEVYNVSEEIFKELDRLEGYPSFYNRAVIKTPLGDAWVYYLEDKDSSCYKKYPVVPDGDWPSYKKTIDLHTWSS